MNEAKISINPAIENIVNMVADLKTLEVVDLVKALEEKFGVSAAAPVMMAVAGGAADVEEKTEFNVVLKDAGAKKIDVIKVARAITGLGLKEAKSLVEEGGMIKEAVAKDEAEKIKKEFEAAGANVELQ